MSAHDSIRPPGLADGAYPTPRVSPIGPAPSPMVSRSPLPPPETDSASSSSSFPPCFNVPPFDSDALPPLSQEIESFFANPHALQFSDFLENASGPSTYTSPSVDFDPAAGFCADFDDSDIFDMDEHELRAEVWRLRQELRSMPTAGPPSTEPAQPRSKPKITTNGKFMKPAKRKAVIEPEDEEADDELEEKAVLEAEDVVIHRGRKRSENGKVTQAPLKLQLSNAIRDKMRAMMGIGKRDALPAPTDDNTGPEGVEYARPKWHLQIKNPINKRFVADAVDAVIAEAKETLQDVDERKRTKIPEEDLKRSIVLDKATTAFNNFAKKYNADHASDPDAKRAKQRTDSRRRRWDRKEKKRKRRAKAAEEQSNTLDVPAHMLHIDYMSSEYSSDGGDDEEASVQWRAIAGVDTDPTKKGPKIFEVRTPRWRSQDLNSMYLDLDAYAAQKNVPTTSKKPRYTHPLQQRFRINPLRDLRPPENAINVWEYDPRWLSLPGKWQPKARERSGYTGEVVSLAQAEADAFIQDLMVSTETDGLGGFGPEPHVFEMDPVQEDGALPGTAEASSSGSDALVDGGLGGVQDEGGSAIS